MSKTPVRQCISCRKQVTRDKLIRLLKATGLNNEKIIINPDRYHFGRSIYLCLSENCVHKAIKEKKILKVLKVSVRVLDNFISDFQLLKDKFSPAIIKIFSDVWKKVPA